MGSRRTTWSASAPSPGSCWWSPPPPASSRRAAPRASIRSECCEGERTTMASNWKSKISSALSPDGVDEEVLDELAQHAAATYASARAEGCDPADADARVERQIAAWAADSALLRRRPRREPAIEPPPDSGAWRAGSMLQDARYAWRLLRRQPAYTAVLVATMA